MYKLVTYSHHVKNIIPYLQSDVPFPGGTKYNFDFCISYSYYERRQKPLNKTFVFFSKDF